jgi:hypothetical protein
MEQKKFLRYCPNCTNYDESTGVCSYIHENVLQYPEKFIEHCDGKYLSLIKGRKIEPFIKNHKSDESIDEDNQSLVRVFSSTSFAVFQMAKSLLNENGIKFWSNGEYMPPMLSGTLYTFEIKVYNRNERAAEKILGKLEPASVEYIPSNSSDKKMQSFIVRRGFLIIILSVVLMIILYYLLK